MADSLSAPYHHINNDVLRFWKDGSLLLASSDLTGRLWSGVMRRFEDADEAVYGSASKPMTADWSQGVNNGKADGGDTNEAGDHKTPPPPVPVMTSAVLESSVADAITLPLTGEGHATQPCRAVVAYDSGAIEVLELITDETGQSAPMFVNAALMSEHDDMVSSLAMSCDHQKLVSSSYDRSIKIWSTESWSTVATYLTAHSNHVLMVSSHLEVPDIFASCSEDGRVLLWDTRQPRPATVIQKSSGIVPSAVVWQPSTEGTKMIIGNETGEIVLKDVRKVDEELSKLKTHDRGITRMEFDPWGLNKIAVTANETKFVTLHLEDDIFSITYQNDSHNDFVRCAAWHPNTRLLYTCAWDGRVLRHDNIQDSESQ